MERYDYNHDCPFEGYITNLGKYNEGQLVGEWVKFPVDEKTLNDVLKRIGIGSKDEFGCPYEEWFITDYDVYIQGISHLLGEFTSIEKLNELAEAIDTIPYYKINTFKAALELESYSTTEDVINIINDLDSYCFLEGVNDYFELGEYFANKFGISDDMKARYFDYEEYGKDIGYDGLITDYGYIERTR